MNITTIFLIVVLCSSSIYAKYCLYNEECTDFEFCPKGEQPFCNIHAYVSLCDCRKINSKFLQNLKY